MSAIPYPLKTKVTASNKRLNSVYLPSRSYGGITLDSRVRATLSGDKGVVAEGALQVTGILSGMARLHTATGWSVGQELSYRLVSPSEIEFDSKAGPLPIVPIPGPFAGQNPASSVFKRLSANYVHLELFRPGNLDTWEPEAEVDVYMAFGVLQEFTNYSYGCGISQELLNRLGLPLAPKPDAILVSRLTSEYLVAEFKVRSSDFTLNHKREDVDVLVVWEDDSTKKDALPPQVLCLQSVARAAVRERLEDVRP